MYYDPSGHDKGIQENAAPETPAGQVGDKGSTSTSRPTWRQSELDAATDFPDYDAQKSFISGEEVPYGTKQSVMIDVRGQNVSDTALNTLYDGIMQRTNNGVEILFKMD